MRTIRTCPLVAAIVLLAAACGGSGNDVTIATDDPPEDPSPARAGTSFVGLPPHGAAAGTPVQGEAAAVGLVAGSTASDGR